MDSRKGTLLITLDSRLVDRLRSELHTNRWTNPIANYRRFCCFLLYVKSRFPLSSALGKSTSKEGRKSSVRSIWTLSICCCEHTLCIGRDWLWVSYFLFLNQFGCVSRSNILLWAGLAGQRWIEGKIDLSSSGTGPSIDHRAYSTLAEWILLKRNVNFISCCISLVWKFQNVVCGFLIKSSPLICHLIDSSSVLLTTPRGQGRGRTVIPGFAVRYISIMLPSQTRHLMCQSQTVVLPSPLPLFRNMRRRVTREEGTTSFSFALLNLPLMISSSKPLHYWYRGQIEGCFFYIYMFRLENLSLASPPCLHSDWFASSFARFAPCFVAFCAPPRLYRARAAFFGY